MKTRLLALILTFVVVPAVSFSAETKPTKHKSVAEENKAKDKRRAELAQIIEQQQRIIDRYERQNAAAKKNHGVTEEQYEQAKATRDKAQAERNALAN